MLHTSKMHKFNYPKRQPKIKHAPESMWGASTYEDPAFVGCCEQSYDGGTTWAPYKCQSYNYVGGSKMFPATKAQC